MACAHRGKKGECFIGHSYCSENQEKNKDCNDYEEKNTKMDREQAIIDSISDLVKIITGLQKNISDLTEASFLMKEHIEKLERKEQL